jgi:hypothetical protein
MSKLTQILFVLLLGGCAFAAAAQAEDEFDKYDIESATVELSSNEAGAHADLITAFSLSEKEGRPYARTRDVVVVLPPGIVGNPEAFVKCSTAQFGTAPANSACPQEAQVGSIDSTIADPIATTFLDSPIYNMPAPGSDVLARFGFFAGQYPIFLNVRLDPETHALIASVEGAPGAAQLTDAETTFWGVPAAPEHDPERLTPRESVERNGPVGGRPSSSPKIPFMTNPTRCGVDRQVVLSLRSYQLPQEPRSVSIPFPPMTGCGALEFNPSTSLAPTTSQGTSGSGLEYRLSLPTKGLQFGNLNYGSELKRAEVVLPAGMTINPSQAEGLGACTEADLARETYDSPPNTGCPEASKIGSVVAETPVIDRKAEGSLYVATPYENPFGALLALYMVLKIPDRGVLVKLAGELRLDPATGRIVTIFDDVPELPVANFTLRFREGARAPLVTPSACGTYEGVSNLTPWSAPDRLVPKSNVFAIESGPSRGVCPAGGLPPFHPVLLAGTLNNAAGTYSPFNLRLTRTDAEQEITHFSIKLPPGLLAKLGGVPYCPDAAIEVAKSRTGAHGGAEELLNPSCPASSEIGTSLVGAGVGDVLTYVPGKVYLAGPYRGSQLSIVAVTAAKAGPFDLGTVVVREALRVNPETAEVFIDATGSDPIPHIVKGVPIHLRDLRVYVDRPQFTINPTNCSRMSTASTVRGAGLDFVSEADNNPLTVSSPFQAADCVALGFRPKLKLSLRGGTKRNQVPSLRAELTARPGDANISRAEVILPGSELLQQANIRGVCTRVQFNAGAGNGADCPAGSIYGRAWAVTPLLDEPLRGLVYLRTNGGERSLPDLVATLHGRKIDINLVGYIDSVRRKGKHGEVISRIRNRFVSVPDAPVKRFVLQMFGGRRGLLVNSTDLCKQIHRAEANFTAQNGRKRQLQPELSVQCGQKGAKAKPTHER